MHNTNFTHMHNTIPSTSLHIPSIPGTSDTTPSALSSDALNGLSAPVTPKRVSVAIGDASTGNNGYSPVVILNETAWQQQFHNGGYPGSPDLHKTDADALLSRQ